MMTSEKAIQLLHRLQDEQFDGEYGDERREALEMAVRALSVDGDTISRQAAMVVFENSGLDDDSKDTVVRVLEQLPSAQSETHDKRTETHACDLISRQAAIDAVVSAMIDGADVELVEGVMELLPSAQPERKKGKCIWCDSPFRIEYNWIDRYGNTASFQDEERHIVATGIAKFCPNCGARMDGESE